ncbi:WLM domain-containing protein [Chaetomium sp. MPI-CAGE-AT-0009]|nr:WLM domain-containing protein [Chaetomium sp. MPI-CAGE-AT-0009]
MVVMSQSPKPLIGFYTHLRNLPRQDEALWYLRTIASLVRPIMRAHGWKIQVLSEMYPEEDTLLGRNVNREQILVRLREPWNPTEFLPLDQMANIMLHELSHMQYWDHDNNFYNLWEQLRLDFNQMLMRGFTGEGSLTFCGTHEPRGPGLPSGNQSFAAPSTFAGSLLAPSFHDSFSQSISRVGSTADIDCDSSRKSGRELQVLSQRWTKDSIKTRAEEASASDVADSQALWDVVKRESRGEYVSSRGVSGSSSFLPSQDAFPSRGTSTASRDPFSSSRGTSTVVPSSRGTSTPSRDPFSSSRGTSTVLPSSRGTSTLSRAPSAASRDPFSSSRDTSTASRDPFGGFSADRSGDSGITGPSPKLTFYWTCPQCTLRNFGPSCNACGASRSSRR